MSITIGSNQPLSEGDIIIQYMDYHSRIDYDPPSIDYQECRRILTNHDAPLDEKKKRSFILAHDNHVQARNILQQAATIHADDQFMRDWLHVCIQELRMYLEMDLKDEDEGLMVMSGAGGDGQRLRHYLVLVTTSGNNINKKQKEHIRNVCETMAAKYDCIIEHIEVQADILIITILLSIDISCNQRTMEAIEDYNQHDQDLFLKGYGVINTIYPSEVFIRETKEHLHAQYAQGAI